jgi:hypothetical protein
LCGEHREAAGVINTQIGKPLHGGSSSFPNFIHAKQRAISTFAQNHYAPSYIFAIQVSPVTVITKNANAIPIFLFVCWVRRYRIDALALPWSASHHSAVQGPFSAIRNEHSGKYTSRPPHCPSYAQLMPLARTTSRFGNPPDLYIFECRACGVSHIDAAWEQIA